MQNAENKSKKFVVLATYAVAVICLLAGFFLPLFEGKKMLALQLGDVFKSLLNKESNFVLSYPVSLFGIEKISFDFTALVTVLYLAVTALSLISLAPIILSVLKEGRLAKKFYYGIEAAAVIVLSLYFIVALGIGEVYYNFVIALAGTALALVVLSALDKGKSSVVKIALFALSAIGFLALFDYVFILGKEEAFEAFTTKLSPALVPIAIPFFSGVETPATQSGAAFLTILFTSDVSKVLNSLTETKLKILLLVAAVTATVVLINFFIDTVKLATKKDKAFGRVFDIARYGLEILLAVATLVLALVCKTSIGLMLIAILAVAALQLAITVVRFIAGLKKKDTLEEADDDILYDEPIDLYDDGEPLLTDGYTEADFIEEEPAALDEYNDEGYTPPSDDGYAAPVEDDDGYISPEEDMKAQEELYAGEASHEAVDEPAAEATESVDEPEAEAKPAEEEIDYEIKTDGTYLLPPEEEIKDTEPEEETAAEETVEAEPEKETEPVTEEPAEEPATEPETEETQTEEDETEETVQKPYHEEIKPYNPYERHSSNPFRNFEQPPQPYNPYAQRTEEKREEKPVQTEKPIQPARTVYEPPKREQKPAYKPYEPPASDRPVRPLRPSPIIQEFKPVPPISEQPKREKQVYTIDKIYAGPIDDFIRKLSNDERIEFAMTFIEKNKGEIGSIPDYVVGGDNKKFFQLSFIYLGRVRGLVSDGLLNKMYKELNML